MVPHPYVRPGPGAGAAPGHRAVPAGRAEQSPALPSHLPRVAADGIPLLTDEPRDCSVSGAQGAYKESLQVRARTSESFSRSQRAGGRGYVGKSEASGRGLLSSRPAQMVPPRRGSQSERSPSADRQRLPRCAPAAAQSERTSGRAAARLCAPPFGPSAFSSPRMSAPPLRAGEERPRGQRPPGRR